MSCGARDDSPSWNLGRVKQGDTIRVDSTCSRRRRQVCKCGCFNRGNVISSERDDRLGSLEVSAVAVMGNLRSTVRFRTSRTDRVGDRGTPEVEGQTKSQMFKRDRVRQSIWKRQERDDAMQLG